MEIKNMTVEQIEARKAEIAVELESPKLTWMCSRKKSAT